MGKPLPRYLEEDCIAVRRRLEFILREVGAELPEADVRPYATAAGDERRLRGLPAYARGTSGAIAGSDPLRALIAKERKNGERRC